MPNRNYEKGYRFERRVKKHLENKGYLVVRSAGSKSPADLVAIPMFDQNVRQEVLLIQCKYGAKISKTERDKLKSLDCDLYRSATIIIAWAKPNKPIKFYNTYDQEWVI